MSDFDRCILILVDGARADVFAELLAAGELPNCKALFADRGGFQRGTTAMPSVSGPAHLPPITGCYPGRSNIPGIRWFDRQRYAQSAFQGQRVRSYMGLNKTARMNREVSATTPSMWESFPDGAAMFCWFTRGLQPGGNLTRGAKVTSWIKGAVTRKWEAGDAASGERLLAAARGDWPFVFTVFPTIDELGHGQGPLSDDSRQAYRSFDGFLPKLRDALHENGDADRTLIVATSDHGQSATHTHFDLRALVKRHCKRVMHFPFAWLRWFDCDAVSNVSGNALAHLSFRGPSGWAERPDVTRSGTPAATVVEALLAEEAIELVVHREGDRLRIRSRKGAALLSRDGGTLMYDVEGADPFGLPPLPGKMTDSEAYALTVDSDHPDALVQWEQLFWSPRCGDVVLTSAPGYDLRTHFEYQDHKGSHGSTWWEHMHVPILASTPLRADARTVDVFPTVLNALGRPLPDQPIDGRDLKPASV